MIVFISFLRIHINITIDAKIIQAIKIITTWKTWKKFPVFVFKTIIFMSIKSRKGKREQRLRIVKIQIS